MFKLFSTRVHGMIDYATALTLPILPRMFGWGRRAEAKFDCIAAQTLASSLITDYELGAARVMPMEGHLKLDAMLGGMALAWAATLDDEEELDARIVLTGVGLFSLFASFTTESNRPRKGNRRRVIKARPPTPRRALEEAAPMDADELAANPT